MKQTSIIYLTLFAMLAACGGETPESAPCVVNASVSCACPGGTASGVQVCQADGTYSPCECQVADAALTDASEADTTVAVDTSSADITGDDATQSTDSGSTSDTSATAEDAASAADVIDPTDALDPTDIAQPSDILVEDIAGGDTSAQDTSSTDTGSLLDTAPDSAQPPLDTSINDTGVVDTGVQDSGPADTGVQDTGPADTGVQDTGPADTGVQDSGPADTGPTDAGPADTGVADAGPDVAPTPCGGACPKGQFCEFKTNKCVVNGCKVPTTEELAKSGSWAAVSQFALLKDGEGCDLNGDAKADNILGKLLTLSSTINGSFQSAISKGELVMLLRASKWDTSGASFETWLLDGALAPNSQGCKTDVAGSCQYTVDPSSFGPAAAGVCPARSVLNPTVIKGSSLAGKTPASGTLRLKFALLANLLLKDLAFSQVALTGQVTDASAWKTTTKGLLCGVITPKSIETAIDAAPDAPFKALGLDKPKLKTLVFNTLQPDVDTDGDQKPDAISAAFALQTLSANLVGSPVCNCNNVECGPVSGCTKSCGSCPANGLCVNNNCTTGSNLKSLGEYCGPTPTCQPPPTGTPSSDPKAQAYRQCTNAQCKTNLCFYSVCTKLCTPTKDTKNNVTGAAGADGIEDSAALSQCANASKSSLAIHGSNYACVQDSSKSLVQATSVCMPAGSWKPCSNNGDCGASEVCRQYQIFGDVQARCGPKSTNPNAATSGKLSEQCQDSVTLNKPNICQNDMCFTIGCSAFCAKDADCITQIGACQQGKCPNGDLCTSDVDCSKWACDKVQISSTSATKYSVCLPKGGCKSNADCLDKTKACTLYYNGVSKVTGDLDPQNPNKVVLPGWKNLCTNKVGNGVAQGQACDPFTNDTDTTLKPCSNPAMCINGYCSGLCVLDQDCPANSKCSIREATYDLSSPLDGKADLSLPYGACTSTKGIGKSCVSTKECGFGKHCKVLIGLSPPNSPQTYSATGRCVDKVADKGDYGATCGIASTGKGLQKLCNSSYCTNTVSSFGQSQPGFCLELCASASDCPSTVSLYNTSYKSVCRSLRLYWNTTVDESDDHYVPACYPVNAKSLMTDCSASKLCPQSDQACIGYGISMSADQPSKVEHLCVYNGNANAQPPSLPVGAQCNLQSSILQCADGYCLADTTTGKGYCSRVCNSNTDCGNQDGMLCNQSYQVLERANPLNAAVMPLCMKAKSCIPCDNDNDCAGNYACTNTGGAGTLAKKICAPTCQSDAQCVGTDGGKLCLTASDDDAKPIAGLKVCTPACGP